MNPTISKEQKINHMLSVIDQIGQERLNIEKNDETNFTHQASELKDMIGDLYVTDNIDSQTDIKRQN